MPALYATVEALAGALGTRSTAFAETDLIRALGAGSRDVDDAVTRVEGCFRPIRKTIYREWPPRQTTSRYRLWLDANPLLSVEALASGGVLIPSSDYFLEPQEYGPPYNRIEINRGSSSAFSYTGATPQRAVAILGLWGMSDDRETVGTLTGDIDDATTTVTVSDASAVGIGDHLVIGAERLEVTGKVWASTATVDTGGIGDSAADTALPVSGGTLVEGELILVGAERMRVRDVAGGTAIVERAVDGSVLAAHLAAVTIYVKRQLRCARGAQGTVALSHSSGATVQRHKVPADVEAYTIGSAATTHLSELSGYTVEIGPEGAQTKLGAGLPALRSRIVGSYGRQMRYRAV